MLLGPLQGADPSEWRPDDRGQLPRAPLLHPLRAAAHARRRGRATSSTSPRSPAASPALGAGVYNMTKWGVVGYSESLRQEGAPHRRPRHGHRAGLRRHRAAGPQQEPDRGRAAIEKMRESTGKVLEAADIANAIVYAAAASRSTSASTRSSSARRPRPADRPRASRPSAWSSAACASRTPPSCSSVYSDPEVMRYWSSVAHADEEPHAGVAGGRSSPRSSAGRRSSGRSSASDDGRVIGSITLMLEAGPAPGRARLHPRPRALGPGLRRRGPAAHRRLRVRRPRPAPPGGRHAPRQRGIHALARAARASAARACLRERWLVGGRFSDSVLWGLLADDWRARRPSELVDRPSSEVR